MSSQRSQSEFANDVTLGTRARLCLCPPVCLSVCGLCSVHRSRLRSIALRCSALALPRGDSRGWLHGAANCQLDDKAVVGSALPLNYRHKPTMTDFPL